MCGVVTIVACEPAQEAIQFSYGQWLSREWRPLVEDSLGVGCRLRDHMDLIGLTKHLDRFFAGDPSAMLANMLRRAVNATVFLRTFGGPLGSSLSTAAGTIHTGRP